MSVEEALSIANSETDIPRKITDTEKIEESIMHIKSKLKPIDIEAENDQKEMVKKIIGPPKPTLNYK